MSPHYDTSKRDDRYHTLALYALAVYPHLVESLPNFVSRFADTVGSSTPPTWQDRLESTIKGITDPEEIAEIIRFILRRTNLPSSSHTRPALLKGATYEEFVSAENTAGYPMDAYASLFLPRIQSNIAELMNEIFEVWAAIATRGSENQMGGGKICLLMGWWICGNRPGDIEEWKELYEEWQIAGRRMEHLFYVWIRYVNCWDGAVNAN
jgi:hypothetical protein